MNYGEALAWLYGTQVFGIKLGPENTLRLLEAAGNPHRRLRFLHVAGTNGKGSVCAMLEAMLRRGNARVGLYTSPHLIDFRERIRLDGTMIPEAAVAEGLDLLRVASAGWDHAPTFFELATVLAAWWLAREKAELVVWETGMGGRLDATNAVTPLVSVITPIGMDHRQWLGDTVAAIAGEKAGIIKRGVPVVSAPQSGEAQSVLEAKARAEDTGIVFVREPYDGPLSLPGTHQRWNAALACAALDAAKLGIADDLRRQALARVEWPGRFQRVGNDLVIDGAHNADGIGVLVETWREVFGAAKGRLVFGALRDKEPGEFLRRLRAIADEVWLVPVASKRSVPLAELQRHAAEAGFTAVHSCGVADALPAARGHGHPVLVAGSLFLAGEVLALLARREPPVPSEQ